VVVSWHPRVVYFMAVVFRLTSLSICPTGHNNVSPIGAHCCQDQRQSPLAQVSWRTVGMRLARIVQLRNDQQSCALCCPRFHHSCSSFHILCSMISRSFAMMCKVATMSLRMSVIGSPLKGLSVMLYYSTSNKSHKACQCNTKRRNRTA